MVYLAYGNNRTFTLTQNFKQILLKSEMGNIY